MTTIPFPVTVISQVQNYITSTYPTLTTKQKNNLYSALLELWFFIKIKHTSDVALLESSNEGLRDSGTAHHNFTNIHRTKLNSFQIRIGKTVLTPKQLIDILSDLKLIEVNSIYGVGKFSKSYRPHVSLAYETIQNVELSLKNIFKNAKSQKDLHAANPHTYRKLIDDMYLVSVDLENLYWHLDQSIGTAYSKNTDAVLTPVKAYAIKIRALKINLGIHFFSVSSTGRVYSSISNMPTIMLPFLKLNGGPIGEIDAVNSQPLLLSNLIDHPQFKADVEAGIFYDKMAESMGITRQEFKKKSYRWIFFNDDKIGSIWANRLNAVYPGLAGMINEVKRKQPLWEALQAAEAAIWIKIAQKQLFPICTRHDSIIVAPEHLESVKRDLVKEYRKAGMRVNLKVEKLSFS